MKRDICGSVNVARRKAVSQPTAGQSVSALRVRFVDATDLVSSAVRALRGRYHRPLQNRAGSELSAGQDSGTVEAVSIGTTSGKDESSLLQGCEPARDSPSREVRLSGVHLSSSESVRSERDDLLQFQSGNLEECGPENP